jgi:hypothetical protein
VSVACQVFALDSSTLSAFAADPAVAQEFVTRRWTQNADDSLWLDKSATGLMEAFGINTGEAQPPASWLLGDWTSPIEVSTGSALLTPEQAQQVAQWCSNISDDDFRLVAANNVMDDDVDYLALFFEQLREFYIRIVAQGVGTLTSLSG